MIYNIWSVSQKDSPGLFVRGSNHLRVIDIESSLAFSGTVYVFIYSLFRVDYKTKNEQQFAKQIYKIQSYISA